MCTKRMYLGFIASLVAGMIISGCSYPGDTSQMKTETVQTKAEIQKQIDQIKSNPSMPDNVKSMALNKLQKDLATAK